MSESESDEDENEFIQDDFLNFSFKHTSNLEVLTKNLAKLESPQTSPRQSNTFERS